MSWVVDEWKDGLPTKTLQKIQELESQLDKLKKERQQRQFQLESLEAAFQKQKQKVESEKSEVTALKRENQSLIELCDNQEKAKQKMAHDQQMKDTQINILEGQLSASKKQIEKLEQELKRSKNDMERSQQSFNGMDMSVCVTPQKSFAASFTPVKFNESKYEELQDKYNKEVEERKKLETELKILQIKLLSQNSQAPQPSSQNTINHRDIARHQASSSVFSWQQERTPSRSSSSSHDTSLKRSFTSTQCPWEQEETPSKRGYKPDTSNRSFCEPFNTAANDQLKSQNQELRSKVNELELRLQVQEKELKIQLNKLQETQTLLEKTQTELQEKDKALIKSRDDLSRVTSQYEQTADRCAQTEQKLKKVTEELSCQRQNAESARLTVENKLKEREKENQQELCRQQNSLKNLEQQLNQMKVKLSQESQQAKNEFNAIQSELDRVAHGKKVLEGEVEELKQKLSKAEQALQASENQANQFKKNLEEAKAQHNAIRSQLDQKTKDSLKMEEEVNVANQTIRQNQQLVDKLTDKISSLEAELKCALQKLQGQDSASLQNLKVTLSNLEKERDLAQEMLRKKDNDMEEAKKALAKMAEESLALQSQLDCKEKECKDLININISLSRWKDEHENDSALVSSKREEMLARVKELECLLQGHMDQLNALENDKMNLRTQVKNLQQLVDMKTADLETQQATCSNIQQQLESEGQKYQNDMDCLVKRIYELEAEMKLRELDNSSSQVSCLQNELQNQKKMYAELQRQHDELLKKKTDVQNEILQINEMHERFVSESQCQIESLQSNISSKQTYVESVVSAMREKEEEVCMLSEKLRLANSDLQSATQNNKELHDKLQELRQLSESWSTERESLTALITSNEKEIEMLTANNKQTRELKNKTLQSVNLGPENDQYEKRGLADDMEEECMADGNKSVKECQSLRMELEELKEKLDRIQKENNRLLRANEELTALVGRLRNNELSLNKMVEELSVSLKDKEMSSKKLQAQLDSLKMDCESGSNSVEDIDRSVSSLQNSSNEGAEIYTDSSSKQETVTSSKALKEKMNILMDGDQSILPDECNPLFSDSKILGDINEETLPLSPEPLHREENQTLLINLDQLSLTSADDVTKSLSQLLELNQNQDQHTASLSPFTSPTVQKVNSDEAGGKVTKDRKSVSGQLVDLILQQAPEDQHFLFSRLTNEDPCTVKDLLTVYQVELSNLRKQYLTDIEEWQQKLKDQASNMEAKLLEEKARSDQLSQELEAARLELQVLDISARSLLFDSEDITTRLDVANQSLCTILPIGRLSLDSELRKCETPKQGQGSSQNNSDESPEEASKEEDDENKGCRRSLRQRKKRKTNTADKASVQGISEHSKLKTAESVKEKEQLLQLVKEKEKNNQHLLMEVKELSLQIEINKTELGIKEGQNQELEQKAKELESERSQLLEKIDLFSTEKLQSSHRIVDLEKALHETLSATELLKAKISELSSIREGLELSNEKWKESYLQAENELRRSKSEKVNIENHALSLEADLDSLQSKCQHLQEESESHLRALNGLEEVLKGVQAEKNQLTQELESLVEEKEELEQMNKKLKESETELESNRDNSKELIKILEAEIRTLKHEIEVAKSTTVQLTSERDTLVLLRENENMQVQELQNLLQQIQEEKQLWSHERQELETQLSTSNSKLDELARSLDRCQVEKHEMATRLNSAQDEVTLMRTGIEKLKVKIESDERKKRQTMEKLKDSERKFDNLNDKIESLERELTMAEENLENAILQTESAKEEAECLKSQKEALEEELNTLRTKLMDLEKELQNSRAKVIELETAILTLTESLIKGEAEHNQFRETSQKELEMLQTQMNNMCEQKAHADQRYEAVIVESAEIAAKMEQESAQLETAKEEVKCLKSQKEAMEEELTVLRGKFVNVENCLQDRQAKVVELETTILTLTETLEQGKSEHAQFRESSEKELEKLQTQMIEMCEQKALTDQRYEAALVESSEITARMEQEKAQLETARKEAKCLMSQKEAMEEELTTLRRKLIDVENCLQDSQAKVVQLETTIHNLEQGEADHTLFKESSKKELELIQAQMNDMREQKALSDQRCEAVKAECAEIMSKMEQEKAQLIQQLEEAQVASCDLKQSIEKHSIEVEECKLQLAQKTQQLETQHRDSDEWESKYSSERSQLEQETENLRNEKINLLSRLEELENKLQTMSAGNASLQTIIFDLKTSYDNLETQLKSANSEKKTLLEKVAELTENCSDLQSKLNDADLHIKIAEEQNCQDRRALEEELRSMKHLHEENNTRLTSAKSKITELKDTITSLRNELESQAVMQKNVIMECEQRLLQAESLHRSILDEAVKQHKEDIDSYQKKLTSMEGLLAAQIQEIDDLKASSSEVSCKAQEQLAGLQAHIDRMTKESAAASEALNSWVNACKQLEEEKEELKKHFAQQEAALESLKMTVGKSKPGLNITEDGMDSSASDPFSEIEELKQCLEEKTQEADESIEKYCNLMIKTHKLEETNDMLKKQVDILNLRLKGLEVKKEQSCPVPDKPLPEDCPPSVLGKPLPERRARKSRRSSQGPGKQSNKRQRDSGNMGSAPSTPQCVTKRVKRTSGTLVEEDVFEPDGLPDVVKKGFADIPSGKQSPFILRRTTTPLRKSPRLASQKNSPSLFTTHTDNLENLADLSSPTPGGSKSQEAKTKETVAMGIPRPVDGQSPLTAHNKMKRRLSEMGTPGKMDTAAVHDDSEEEGTCQVQ